MSDMDKVFIRRHAFWLAWYPKRGRRCQVRVDSVERYAEIALGPLYFCAGPGLPAV